MGESLPGLTLRYLFGQEAGYRPDTADRAGWRQRFEREDETMDHFVGIDVSLTLQLHFSSKVCLPRRSLMGPSPHRPCDDMSRVDLTLGQPIGDAPDLLD